MFADNFCSGSKLFGKVKIIMKRNKITFIVFAVIFLVISLGIDMRNAVSNGQIFIMNGDFLDQMHFYLQIPGSIPTFLVVWIFFKNMHAYNFYFMWSFTLLFNCLFYGYAGYLIYPKIKSFITSKRGNTSRPGEQEA